MLAALMGKLSSWNTFHLHKDGGFCAHVQDVEVVYVQSRAESVKSSNS